MQESIARFHVPVVGPDRDKKVLAPLHDQLVQLGVQAPRSHTLSAFLDDKAALAAADVLICAPGFKVDRGLMQSMPKLRAVLSPVAGFDGFDVPAATALGVAVANATIRENFDSMTEAMVLLILAGLYDLPGSMALMAPDAGPDTVRRRMLGGKMVGVVGYGNIGQGLVSRLANWGVRIQVCAPRLHSPLPPDAQPVELRELMATSDVICLACSLNDETRGMVTGDLLASLKPQALLVSVARDQIIDQAALVDVCGRRPDIRLAMDSFSRPGGGPLATDSPLRALANAILTPHVIGHTVEGLGGLIAASIDNLRHIFRGEPPPRLLNPEVVSTWQGRWGRS